MIVSGHETYPLVLAALAALHAEPPKSEAHAEAIAAQIAIFEKSAEHFEAEIAAQIEKENAQRFGRAAGQAQHRGGYGRYVAQIAEAADAAAAKEAKPKKHRAKKQTA